MKVSALFAFSLLFSAFLAGCSLFRANPLRENRGAVVLVLDTRTFGDLKALRQTLSRHDARATVFMSGQITRGTVLKIFDLEDLGCEAGLSGLKGVNPQTYSRMYGQQKYFQDEIVTQYLDARRLGLSPRYFLLDSLLQAKSETLTLPTFLTAKGFARIVHKMPAAMQPRSRPAADLTDSMVHTYALTVNNFDAAQIAALAKHNEVLVVSPSQDALPLLLEEAKAQGVPFATLADLPVKK